MADEEEFTLADVDWTVVAQRIATEAGITDIERIGGINKDNYLDEIKSQTGKDAGEVAASIKEQGYTYDSRTDTFSDQQIAARDYGGEEGEGGAPPAAEEDDFDQTELLKSVLMESFTTMLLSIGLDNTTAMALANWAEQRFLSDPTFTAAQAKFEMYETEAFKKRFSGIATMRDANKAATEAGQPIPHRDIPKPGDYINREKLLSGLFIQHGMDKLPYDLDHVVEQSYIQGISGPELVERTTMASNLIYQSPEAVTNAAEKYFGVAGDAALMATFLDPDDNIFGTGWQSLQSLKTDVAAAEVGGWSQMFLDLDSPLEKQQARNISKLSLTTADLWKGLKSVKAQEALFFEKQGERDLDMETHGLAAEFGVDYGEESAQELEDTLERRAERRKAVFRGGGTGQAGAIISGQTTGIGSANA
jgi:hypothetical protein